MKYIVHDRVVRSRLPEGPLAAHIDSFAEWADKQGYVSCSVYRRVLLGSSFSQWLGKKGVRLQDPLPRGFDPRLHRGEVRIRGYRLPDRRGEPALPGAGLRRRRGEQTEMHSGKEQKHGETPSVRSGRARIGVSAKRRELQSRSGEGRSGGGDSGWLPAGRKTPANE